MSIDLKDVITFEIDLTKIDEIIENTILENQLLSEQLLEDKEGTPANNKVKLQNKISDLKHTMDVANQRYQQYLEDSSIWEARRKEIEGGTDIPNSLGHYKSQINKLNKYPDELEAIKNERKDIVQKIYNEIISLAQMYKSLYNPIDLALSGNPLKEKGLEIGFKVSIVPENFENKLFSFIQQGRRGSFCGVEEGQKILQNMLCDADFSTLQGAIDFTEKIDYALANDIRNDEHQSVKISELVRKGIDPVEVYDYVFGLEYLIPRYELTWGTKTLEQLSPGERGALLLVFYLLVDKDTIPIVIDQPEENLDNESVYKMLVPCIKQAKERRQVIIVTHNPNLAVVCDADQIIYCEIDKSNGNRVSYTTGSIENPIINHHIINVLEGTRPAFDIRDAKYRLVKK